MQPRLLILETSDRVGAVALAAGASMVAEQRLDATRRHARDLAPTIARLLADQHWQPADLAGVIVSRGPGSYTGLRVGVMSAKALAYATGCALLGVDTFAAIALQADGAERVDVLADAQQDKVYVQPFARVGAAWRPIEPLAIRPWTAWCANRDADVPLTGPGLRKLGTRLPTGTRLTDEAAWDPTPASLLRLGLARWQAGERDDPFGLEPLYLRPSSAEEQWATRAIDAGAAPR